MDKVALRLLRLMYANKGRIKPRDEQTEFVHSFGDFLFSTDGTVFTVAPNICDIEEGSWGGKVTLSEFSGELMGKPSSRLLNLLPRVRDSKVNQSIVIDRNALLSAVKNLNCETVKIELREVEGEYNFLLVYGDVTDDMDGTEVQIPVLSVVAQKNIKEQDVPVWFPTVE